MIERKHQNKTANLIKGIFSSNKINSEEFDDDKFSYLYKEIYKIIDLIIDSKMDNTFEKKKKIIYLFGSGLSSCLFNLPTWKKQAEEIYKIKIDKDENIPNFLSALFSSEKSSCKETEKIDDFQENEIQKTFFETIKQIKNASVPQTIITTNFDIKIDEKLQNIGFSKINALSIDLNSKIEINTNETTIHLHGIENEEKIGTIDEYEKLYEKIDDLEDKITHYEKLNQILGMSGNKDAIILVFGHSFSENHLWSLFYGKNKKIKFKKFFYIGFSDVFYHQKKRFCKKLNKLDTNVISIKITNNKKHDAFIFWKIFLEIFIKEFGFENNLKSLDIKDVLKSYREKIEGYAKKNQISKIAENMEKMRVIYKIDTSTYVLDKIFRNSLSISDKEKHNIFLKKFDKYFIKNKKIKLDKKEALDQICCFSNKNDENIKEKMFFVFKCAEEHDINLNYTSKMLEKINFLKKEDFEKIYKYLFYCINKNYFWKENLIALKSIKKEKVDDNKIQKFLEKINEIKGFNQTKNKFYFSEILCEWNKLDKKYKKYVVSILNNDISLCFNKELLKIKKGNLERILNDDVKLKSIFEIKLLYLYFVQQNTIDNWLNEVKKKIEKKEWDFFDNKTNVLNTLYFATTKNEKYSFDWIKIHRQKHWWPIGVESITFSLDDRNLQDSEILSEIKKHVSPVKYLKEQVEKKEIYQNHKQKISIVFEQTIGKNDDKLSEKTWYSIDEIKETLSQDKIFTWDFNENIIQKYGDIFLENFNFLSKKTDISIFKNILKTASEEQKINFVKQTKDIDILEKIVSAFCEDEIYSYFFDKSTKNISNLIFEKCDLEWKNEKFNNLSKIYDIKKLIENAEYISILQIFYKEIYKNKGSIQQNILKVTEKDIENLFEEIKEEKNTFQKYHIQWLKTKIFFSILELTKKHKTDVYEKALQNEKIWGFYNDENKIRMIQIHLFFLVKEKKKTISQTFSVLHPYFLTNINDYLKTFAIWIKEEKKKSNLLKFDQFADKINDFFWESHQKTTKETDISKKIEDFLLMTALDIIDDEKIEIKKKEIIFKIIFSFKIYLKDIDITRINSYSLDEEKNKKLQKVLKQISTKKEDVKYFLIEMRKIYCKNNDK